MLLSSYFFQLCQQKSAIANAVLKSFMGDWIRNFVTMVAEIILTISKIQFKIKRYDSSTEF